MVVVRHPAPYHANQMILWLQVRGVRRQIDQPEPVPMALEEGGDLTGFFRPMDMGIVTEHDDSPPPRPGTPNQRVAQGAEGLAIPMVGVAAHDRPVSPVGGGEEMAFPIGPRGRNLPLVAAAHPAARQRGQQRQFRFVLDVQIDPRRRAQFERLGATLFA